MAVNVVGDAYIVVHALTDSFKREVERSLRDINPMVDQAGRDVGGLFSNGVNDSLRRTGGLFRRVAEEAEINRQAFNRLIRVGYFLGPAIAGVAASLSALVFGLFSVISAVGTAIPALGALGGAFVALAQAVVTARVAFGGIGRAVQALTRQEGQAIQNKRRLADAQRALNRALREGLEYIQQLGFDVEDAAIAEQRAAMDLEAARQELFRMRDLPPDNRARREAELAFQEADLNYRRAVDRLADLKKEQDQVRGNVENLEPVIDARRNLARLQEDINAGGGGANSVANAMKDLSPEAQRFARFLASLKPVLLELRAAAGQNLFGPLERAIRNLLTMLPTFKQILRDTGGVLGEFSISFSEMLTRNEGRIQEVFGQTNIIVLRNLSAATVALSESFLIILDALQPLTIEFSKWVKLKAEDLRNTLLLKEANGELADSLDRAAVFAKAIGAAIKATSQAFRELGRGASDAGLFLIRAFTDSMRALRDWAAAANESGELPKTFMAIAKNVASIGRFVGAVVVALFNISSNPGVGQFFDNLAQVPKIFEDMANELLKTGPEMGRFFTEFSILLKNLTESGAIETFFNILSEALGFVNRLFENDMVMRAFVFLSTLKAITLAFGTIISVARFFGLALFGTLRKAIGILGLFTLTKMTSGFLTAAVAVETATKALGGFAAGSMKIKFLELGRSVGLLAGQLKLLAIAGFKALLSPVGLVVLAIAAIVGIFIAAYKNSEKLREAIASFWELIKSTVGVAFQELKGIFQELNVNLEGSGDLFRAIGDFIATYIVPIFRGAFLIAINVVIGAIKGLVRIIGSIGKMFEAVWNVVAGIFALMTGRSDDAAKRFRKSWESLKLFFKNLFGGILEPFIGLINGFIDIWNDLVKRFGKNGRLLGLSTIERINLTAPAVARNINPNEGVARAAAAAVASRAAAITRAEARDRAAAGRAGSAGVVPRPVPTPTPPRVTNTNVNITVNPSQGMDEREVASIVSRELALQLRRGGAGT